MNRCSICGSYAININKTGDLCDVHFYKVQRDDLLDALQALMTDFGGTASYASASPEATQARAAIAEAVGGAA